MSRLRDNLDVLDKYHTKDIWEHEGVIYNGDTKRVLEKPQSKDEISPLLAAAVLGLNNTGTPTPDTDKYANIWTDIDAQEIYLNTKPTCYLVISKPGVPVYNLGEALAKKYNCLHLCPLNIIMDEIAQGSRTGKCLDFNMRHNRICGYQLLLKMLKIKLKSPAVQHRGYIITGFPLVCTSRQPTYLIKPNISEEALLVVDELLFDVIYNLKRKPPKTPKTKSSASSVSSDTSRRMEEEEIEEEHHEEEQLNEEAEEEEVVAELPKFILNTCDDIIYNVKAYYETTQAALLHQFTELFNLNLEPDIIIHATCPDVDVLSMKLRKYVNYKKDEFIFEPFPTQNSADLRWPDHDVQGEYENPLDLHTFDPKYNCRPPINFRKRGVGQICNYRDYLLPYMENKIMDYDPKQVIKIDGRHSIHQHIEQIKERLLLMDVQPVFIPAPLYITDPPEELEEFWKTVEELQVIRSGVVAFKNCASPWLNRCPVELKKRQSVVGKPKLAVMFFKHVYLLSSLNNFVTFCANPRPFLKLQYLEPTCRIIVTGTRSSGKSMTAECLSWLFDTPVTSFKAFTEVEKQKKYQIFAENIFGEISPAVEDTRISKWKNKEEERLATLNNWNSVNLAHLKQYFPLLVESTKYFKKPKSTEEIVEEEDVFEENVHEELVPDEKFLKKFGSLRDKLSFLPILDNVQACQYALENQSLIQYGPLELLTPTEKPLLPAKLEDDDIKIAISEYIIANDVQKDLEPTVDELMNEFNILLSTIDTTHQCETNLKESYGKYIVDDFPADPEYWELLGSAKLLPDYTVALIENRELEPELLLRYLDIEKAPKNYYEVLLAAKDPLILSKLQTKLMSNKKTVDVEIIVNELVNGSLSSFNKTYPEEEGAAEPDPKVIEALNTELTESIEKFREAWDSIKIKLEEKFKCYIEIELEEKTDVQTLEEVLSQIRQSYCLKSEINEGDEPNDEEADKSPKNLLTYNSAQNLCETNNYCPITFYDYGVLWRGKPEFSLIYNNKLHYFAREEYIELFQKDVTKYQAYNKPFKTFPKLKICVTGCIGSGKTLISKRLAKELGLIHIDLENYINNFYMPRHFKKVGRQYENPFVDEPIEEEGVVEFQVDEENPNYLDDLLTNLLSNEAEFRRTLFLYYERGLPILPIMMQKLIKKIWFDSPYANIGFILDGYPRLPQDIEDMLQSNCIPDLIIEIDCSSEKIVERIGPLMLKKWKSQFNEAKLNHKIKMDSLRKEWMRLITKKVVPKLIIEDIIEGLPIKADAEIVKADEEPVDHEVESKTKIDAPDTLETSNAETTFFRIYNEVKEEFPEPTDTREWDNPEEQREGIDSRIEATYETDYENIQSAKEMAEENNIPIMTINGSKSFQKVIKLTLFQLSDLRNRNQSYFEQTYIITMDIADLLLSKGHCFLSKFGRLCPVYIYENREATHNSYKISKLRKKLFPVIHRAYVYFISSEDNVKKFRTNPLKYVISDAIKTFYPYPLRIGVIGTVKSGKSFLAQRLAKQYNLLYLSRGTALRKFMKTMYWTDLGSKILKRLENGEVISSEYLMGVIQTMAIDNRTVTYGFVLDGFPALPEEAMALARYDLYPTIVFDIQSDKQVILENSQKEVYYDILKYKPPYSYSFIEYRFNKWNEQCYKIRNWIYNDYQNLCALNGNESKWKNYDVANNKIKEVSSKIHYYLANVERSIVPASVMAISNYVFEKNMSSFKNMCPACLSQNVIRHNEYPRDKAGVVQFKGKFYWICADHIKLVLAYPNYYLSKEVNIPEVPAVVEIINPNNVYENGICIVTYTESLPDQKLERGTNKYAAVYKNKTYLFCSETCMRKFLYKPHLYSDITIFKGPNWGPRLSLKKLPDLGYLEQTLANILTETCCSLNAFRPKYPGLNFQLSAFIYIGLYLKTHNPRLSKEESGCYRKALKIFECRSRLILDLGLRMRSMENPFLTYPVCQHGTSKYYSPIPSLQGEVLSSTGNNIPLLATSDTTFSTFNTSRAK